MLSIYFPIIGIFHFLYPEYVLLVLFQELFFMLKCHIESIALNSYYFLVWMSIKKITVICGILLLVVWILCFHITDEGISGNYKRIRVMG